MNKLYIFKHDDFGDVRVLRIGDNLWFAGKDVAAALGYKDTAKAIRRHVWDEDKCFFEIHTEDGMQKLVFINTAGISALVSCRKSQNARKFDEWIATKIIPTIRDDANCDTEQRKEEAQELSETELLAKALLIANKEIEKRDERIGKLEGELQALHTEIEDGNQERSALESDDDLPANDNSSNIEALTKLLLDILKSDEPHKFFLYPELLVEDSPILYPMPHLVTLIATDWSVNE